LFRGLPCLAGDAFNLNAAAGKKEEAGPMSGFFFFAQSNNVHVQTLPGA
jgi:hypothetical protein